MFVFLPPIAGFISDVFGYKRTMVSTAVLESVFMFMYAFVRSYVELFAVRIFQEAMIIVLLIAGLSYVELFAVRIFQALIGAILSASFLHFASTYAKRAGVYIGLLRFSQALGMALGSLVVFLFPVKQVRVFILIASILCLMPVSAAMLNEYSEPRKHINLRNVLQCVISGDLVFYYACALANTLTVSILFSYIVVYMIESFDLDLSIYALIIFMTTMTFGISSVVAGKISDKYPRESGFVGTIGIMISIILIVTSNNIIYIVFGLILFEGLSAFAYNPLYVVLSKRLPDEVRGTGINVADTLLNISFIALPILEIVAKRCGYVMLLFIPLLVCIFALATISIVEN